MKKFLSVLLIIGLLSSMLGSCGSYISEGADLNITEVKSVTDSMDINSFDEKFLNYIAEKTDGNYMVSPLSFRYALGLLIAGAEGETKAELLNALGISSVDEWTEFCRLFNGFVVRFDEDLAKEIEDYKEYKKDGYVPADSNEPFRALKVANSIWKRSDIKPAFKDEYVAYVLSNYAAESYEFTEKNAVKLINEWASKKTEGMINKLLADNYNTRGLAVCLMNALYFKDSWTESFNKNATFSGDFITKSGTVVSKEFMEQKKTYRYYKDDETQLVIIPMKGDLYMSFVLGSRDNLKDKIEKAEYTRVDVRIPKMDIESSYNNGELVEFLLENGVTKAFDSESADFSSMIDWKIYVSDIIQKTKIKTDEDGVEAAAVTAIMMKDSACLDDECESFNADSPFSFYIYATANDTTAILFGGEMVE